MSELRARILSCSAALVAAVILSPALRAEEPDRRVIDAAKTGNHTMMRELLRTRVNVNVSEIDGTTALAWATRNGDSEGVQLLLKGGADPKLANRYGVTPLALAAVNGDAATIELLLTAGADPNSSSPEGETALMTAARTGNLKSVTALLAHHAAVNASETWQGETALMWAAAENHGEVVRALAAGGAELDARSKSLKFPKYTYNASTMVTTPLPRGEMTALLMASRQGAFDGVKALVAAGANLDIADPVGTTPLMMAIVNRHNDVAALLIEHGADPNLTDSSGMGALYAAVDLRTLGPLINRPTPKATSTVDNAEIVAMLLDYGADPDVQLHLPIQPRFHNSGDKQLAEGATPLMRAARTNDLPVMRLLLDHGADANLATRNFMTALLFAAAGGGRVRASDHDQIESLTLLLDAGADINAFDTSGATALALAVPKSDEVVKFLASRGADLDVRDKQGRTPIDIAMGRTSAFNDPRADAAARPAARPKTVELLQQLKQESTGTAPAAAEARLPQ
jgi:ankyrin repeat protein